MMLHESLSSRTFAKFALLTLILCLGIALPASAQSTNAGTVLGVVNDSSGAVVADAAVTLTDLSTKTSRSLTTNSAGRYVFVNVNPGNYELSFTKQGFTTTKTQITVSVGQAQTLNMALKVGAASTVVEVTAVGNELETLNSTIGNTVTAESLSNLPALGRDTSTFVTLQPGVSPDGSAAGTVVDQAVFMLDGGNNSNDMDGSGGVYNRSFGDDPTGGLFSNVNNPISGGNAGINGYQPSGVMPTPVDSVEEFKVSTTNQGADFNNSSGMQVAIVTKRGSNTWHGTAYEYYLDNNFSGNTWENNFAVPKVPVPDWHRSWFGVAGGGPLISHEILGGKTYFFANYQGTRFPLSETITKLVPSPAMRLGLLSTDGGATYTNLNPTSVMYNGTTYPGTALDPRSIGINSFVQQLWNKYMPAPTAGIGCGQLAGDTFCDGTNTLAFSANVRIPETDNFGVARIDHDFGQKWHFQSSFRYYHLKNATDDQIDIGGFFPGDTLGTPTSLSSHPQVPWYLVLGVTTNISSRVTNDFRYSFLRNWWAWASSGDPAQFSTLGAALEPLGEKRSDVAAPYNINTQQTRTRFWDGKDHFFRDDATWLKGNHLVQFGGQYQRNWNYHQRTDNGGGVNYYPVYQLGDSAGSGKVDMSALGAAFGTNTTLAREAAAVLGIVTDSQQAYTYTGSGGQLVVNGPLTPAFDKVTIPYYNIYVNDTWKVKPSITLTYGLGWALEMPPSEEKGKQVLFVGPDGSELSAQTYLANRQAAALAGQVYNPTIGFSLLPFVTGHPSHPYDPFYHAFSPRVAVAWNPDFARDTVIRGGYGRIYGRLNGVGLVLGPLLSPGLIEAVKCQYAFSNGTCGTSGTIDTTNAFRIGTDGTSAPIPAATPTLPQPLFPGVGGNIEALTASPTDPHFRPNSVDSFDLTVQHQFTRKISLEVGGISRWIHNELLSINLNSVPYMMTLGGQQFKTAYANIEKAMGCATSYAACKNATVASTLANLAAPQQFFETALAGTGYCFPGVGGCTAALVTNEFGNLQSQSVFNLWSDLDTGGVAPGFNFPLSMMNSTGQIGSNVAMATSLGHGNYNALFATLKANDWNGVTLQNNFTWSRALGTGGVVQATSQQASVDPWNNDTQYGTQPSDRAIVDTLLLVYQVPFYRSQQGILGRVLGGWTPSFIFAAGTGSPLPCGTQTGSGGEGYSGGQDFGSGDGNDLFTDGNCILTGPVPSAKVRNYSNSTNGVLFNIFSNPTAVSNSIRPLILGIDNRSGGYGQFRGLNYWNLNFAVKKNVLFTERFNAEASLTVNNVLNHNQLLDPSLSALSTPVFTGGASSAFFGQIPGHGSTPRTMEIGIRFSF